MLKLGSREKRWKDNYRQVNPNGKDNYTNTKKLHQQTKYKEKRNGILAVQPVSKRFLKKVTSLVDSEESRANFFEALRSYHQSRNVKRLVRDLKSVLDTEKKYDLFKEIRALIPEDHLRIYDKLVKLNRRGERLIRIKKRGNEPMGFTFRGGKEHGTGFFITSVITGSMAALAGLKVGDEFRKINGLPLSESIHDEVLAILKNDRMLNFVVRNDGRIPSKVKKEIIWTNVEIFQVSPRDLLHCDDIQSSPNNSIQSSDTNKEDSHEKDKEKDNTADRYMSLNVEDEGLGCSIDADANGHAGIYITAIEKSSLAEQAGLKVGDQILNVCGKDFDGVTYAEALQYLQKKTTLTIIARYNEDVAQSLLNAELHESDDIKPILVKEPRSERNAKSAAFGSSIVVEYSEDDKLNEEAISDDGEIIIPGRSNFDYPAELLCGREVHYIAIEKDGTLGMNLECKKDKVMVHNISPGGAVKRHGFLKSGDWILSCEGYDLMGIPLSQAQSIISMVMQRWSRYIEFIVACPPSRIPPDLPNKKETSAVRKDLKKPSKKGSNKVYVDPSHRGGSLQYPVENIEMKKSAASLEECNNEELSGNPSPLVFDPEEIILSSEVDDSATNKNVDQFNIDEGGESEEKASLPPSLDIFSNPIPPKEDVTYLEAATLSNSDPVQSSVVQSADDFDIFEGLQEHADVPYDDDTEQFEVSTVLPSAETKSRRSRLASFFLKTNKGKKSKSAHSKHKLKLFPNKKEYKEKKDAIMLLDATVNKNESEDLHYKNGDNIQVVPPQYKSDLLLMISEDEPYGCCISEQTNNCNVIKSEIECAGNIESVEVNDDIRIYQQSSGEQLQSDFCQHNSYVDETPKKNINHENVCVSSSPQCHQVPVVAVVTDLSRSHPNSFNFHDLAATEDTKVESEISDGSSQKDGSVTSSLDETNDSQNDSDANKTPNNWLAIKETIKEFKERRCSQSEHDTSDGNNSSDDKDSRKKRNIKQDILLVDKIDTSSSSDLSDTNIFSKESMNSHNLGSENEVESSDDDTIIASSDSGNNIALNEKSVNMKEDSYKDTSMPIITIISPSSQDDTSKEGSKSNSPTTGCYDVLTGDLVENETPGVEGDNVLKLVQEKADGVSPSPTPIHVYEGIASQMSPIHDVTNHSPQPTRIAETSPESNTSFQVLGKEDMSDKESCDEMKKHSVFSGPQNLKPRSQTDVAKRIFTEEEIAGFNRVNIHESKTFFAEGITNEGFKDRSIVFFTDAQRKTTVEKIKDTKDSEAIISVGDANSSKNIGALKNIFSESPSPRLSKDLNRRHSMGNTVITRTVDEPVCDLGSFRTFTPPITLAKQNTGNACVVFESNLKVSRDKNPVVSKCFEPEYEAMDDKFRTSQTLTHEEVLSISRRMCKKGKVRDIITDVISDSSSNPSPRSPTGIEVKSILLKNRKNSPKKVQFCNKVRVGTAYHPEEEEEEVDELYFANPTPPPCKISNVANPSARGVPAHPSPAFKVLRKPDDTNRAITKQSFFVEDNRDDDGEIVRVDSRLLQSSQAMRNADGDLRVRKEKQGSAFVKITNLDE